MIVRGGCFQTTYLGIGVASIPASVALRFRCDGGSPSSVRVLGFLRLGPANALARGCHFARGNL